MRWFGVNSRWNEDWRWFGFEPQTNTEYLDQPAWERVPGATLPSGATLTASRLAIYSIEVRSSVHALIDGVDRWFDGRLRFEVDEASRLSFSVTADDAIVASLVTPNIIWVRDRWGMLLETFRIRSVIKTRDGEKTTVRVNCQSALVALGIEPVINYSTGYDDDWVPVEMTVGAIVGELLDLQVQSPSITLGRIDSTIRDYSLSFYAGDTTVLAALRDLQARLPQAIAGHFYVDNRGRLNWRVRIGSHRGEALAVGSALAGIEYSTSYEDMVTRLYLYGEGDDPTYRVRLTDVGADEPEEYIESATVGTYGVIPLVIWEKSIRTPQALLEVAERLIEELGQPVIEIGIDAIDLAKADGTRFPGANDLYIGSTYTVTDAALSVSTDVSVVAIEPSMENPLQVKVELTNRRRSLADLLASILKSINSPLNVDGVQYPTMGRNYTTAPAVPRYRAGDTRYNANPQMYNGTDWEDMNAAAGNAVKWNVANYAAFAALTLDADGDLGYTLDLNNLYINKAGTYRIAGVFKQATEPVGIGEQNGDHWYDTNDFNHFVLRGAAWRITHPWVDTSAPVSNIGNGDFWYDSGATILYQRHGTNWLSYHPTHESGTAPTNGVTDGDLWYDSTLHQMMARRNGVWRIIHAHIANSAPSTNVLDGDLWYEEDSDHLWYRRAGTWNIVPRGTTQLSFWDGSSLLDVTHFST